MKKGDITELSVTDINNLGCGVARLDGKVIFIKGAVSGDTVRARIIKDSKSFAVARLEAVLVPSPYRCHDDFCKTALSCGGCIYRHITYEHEKQIKQHHVRSCFDKAGLPEVKVLPVTGAGEIHGYRNKAQFPVMNTKDGMKAGFYASKTHTVIPVDNCSLQNPSFSEITACVCRLCDKYGISAYNEETQSGLLRHIYLRIGEATEEIMLCLVVNGNKLPHETEFVSELVARFPKAVSIILNENTENTNVVLGKHYRTLYGKGYIEDVLCGLSFRISPESFYQVNRRGAELLYTLAADMAGLDGTQTLVDLYCGTGTIGLSMAKRAKKLIGIEIVEGAVECARQNAVANGIENAGFVCADAGSAEVILSALHRACPDTVIIDPPRRGSTRELAEQLAALGVPKIVYISCEPSTLARDCTYFKELGYTVGNVQPVDMFPRTGHVESVVCLTRK